MALPKAKFVIDSQTLTQAIWFIVPGGMAYAYAYFNTESEGDRIQDMENNSTSIITSARKGSTALGPIFAQRKQDGKFNPEMEQKLDDLLRAGNKKIVRTNADNEAAFHMKGGAIGLSKGRQNKHLVELTEELPESDDWRAGLKGGDIIKEQKRRRKLLKKQMRKIEKKEKKSKHLREELFILRTTVDTPEVITRKKDIKKICKELGIDYNSPIDFEPEHNEKIEE